MINFILISTLFHAAFAGVIESKIDNHRALILYTSHQLKEGDRVLAYKKTCTGAKVKLCKSALAGEGAVTKTRDNQHYEVEFEDHIELTEICSVEKK
ncbi:hypothetical protein [Bdellovibrio sp. GT3]|uniref:hypothetical protein n=1 Tax=Bdellovibrio sp. GT3 TaxID=3136282 RepID=UPI0030F0F17C